MDNTEQIIVCAEDGEVRGYLPADTEQGQAVMDEQQDAKALTELEQRKSELLLELHR